MPGHQPDCKRLLCLRRVLFNQLCNWYNSILRSRVWHICAVSLKMDGTDINSYKYKKRKSEEGQYRSHSHDRNLTSPQIQKNSHYFPNVFSSSRNRTNAFAISNRTYLFSYEFKNDRISILEKARTHTYKINSKITLKWKAMLKNLKNGNSHDINISAMWVIWEYVIRFLGGYRRK